MQDFEFAQPRTEEELLNLLASQPEHAVLLAGGTDLVGLMKQSVVSPRRVVHVAEIATMKAIEVDSSGAVWIGAAVPLDGLLDATELAAYPAVQQILHGFGSLQRISQGTLGGELFRRPACWYFRAGHGLLADNGRKVENGDNRYHAILGNRGPAKFVSPSRLAPALIALEAQARVRGPGVDAQQSVPLESLFRTPHRADQQEFTLGPGQIVTHIILPPHRNRMSAAYEVRHGAGPEPPLAAAAVQLNVTAATVRQARIVMGQVAPVPWLSPDAAGGLVGRPLDAQTAHLAGWEAVARATPLSCNHYKVQLAAVAVERAILRAAGLETGEG